jgi:hypothetical protein
MTTRKIHPAANIFPMMSAAAFAQLKASIEEIGLQEPVVLWRGQIIDGRNRLRACEELGIEPQEAELEDDADPVAFALAANQLRRNITNKSQLAICAAKLAGLKHGGDRKSEIKVPNGTLIDVEAIAAEEAGKTFGVSRMQVFRALRVLREGCETLQALCADGEVAVSLACKFLDEVGNGKEQAKVCKGGRQAIRNYITPPDDEPDEEDDDQPRPDFDLSLESSDAANRIRDLFSSWPLNVREFIPGVLRGLSKEDVETW